MLRTATLNKQSFPLWGWFLSHSSLLQSSKICLVSILNMLAVFLVQPYNNAMHTATSSPRISILNELIEHLLEDLRQLVFKNDADVLAER